MGRAAVRGSRNGYTRAVTRSAPTSRLFLARHGQTAGNVEGVLRGPDSRHDGLTAQGRAQAHALARRIAALNPDSPRIFASTYARAQQTAAPVADLLGVTVTVLDGLQEIDPGAWRGRPYSDLDGRFDELVGPGDRVAFPGGESQQDVADRFEAALKPVLEGAGTPIVVSHGGVLISVLIRLLGDPVVQTWRSGRFAHANAALTQLRRTEGRWNVENLAENTE